MHARMHAQVKVEHSGAFEEVWRNRESKLKEMPGFVRFAMLKCERWHAPRGLPPVYVYMAHPSQHAISAGTRVAHACMRNAHMYYMPTCTSWCRRAEMLPRCCLRLTAGDNIPGKYISQTYWTDKAAFQVRSAVPPRSSLPTHSFTVSECGRGQRGMQCSCHDSAIRRLLHLHGRTLLLLVLHTHAAHTCSSTQHAAAEARTMHACGMHAKKWIAAAHGP